MGGGAPSPPPPDPELERRLAEQRAEAERLKQEEEARVEREKQARLRGLRGASELFGNRFTGFADDGTTTTPTTDTLGKG